MSGDLISEEVRADNKQVNVRMSSDTYDRFMSRKEKMHLKGFSLSMSVAINDGLEQAIERADVWLAEHTHLRDRNKARMKRDKVQSKPTVDTNLNVTD